MNKNFKDNAYLSEDGKQLVSDVVGSVRQLLNHQEVRNMSETELQVLGSNIANIVGNMISNEVVARRANQFHDMTDEQFEVHLKNKYGEHWMLVSLTKEEIERLPEISTEDLKKALEKGQKEREAYLNMVPSIRVPDIYFK